MNPMARFSLVLCAALTTLLNTVPAHAAVIIHGTRVIYPAEQQEVVVRLENKGDRPTLVQTWLDDGDTRATPATAQAPFIVTPPIFRIEPNKQHALRLRYNGETQPNDRESLFWLNVLEVQPQSAEHTERNLMELSFRTRLRVYFRPQGLPYAKPDAAAKLTWKLVPEGAGFALEVNNPTPYFLSLGDIALTAKGSSERHTKSPNREVNDSLLFPFTPKRFALPTLRSRVAGAAKVEFIAISDFGSRVSHSANLTP